MLSFKAAFLLSSFTLTFDMMYSAYKLNKQNDNGILEILENARNGFLEEELSKLLGYGRCFQNK